MSTTCSTNATVTITDSAQANALATCTTFSGSIAVGESFRGDLALDGIELITGSLHADNILGLTSFAAESLHTVGAIHINGSRLTELSLPALQTATDGIDVAATSLQRLNLPSLMNQMTSVSIQDNTGLTDVSIPKLAIANFVTVQGNGHGELRLDLSSLRWVTHLRISQCSSVDVSSLDSAGDAVFAFNTFPTLSLPALTSVLGGLIIDTNANLADLSAPVLTKVQLPDDANPWQNALAVSGNDALTGTIEFPAAVEITHNADIYGTFSNFSLPALNTFSGKLTLESTADIASTCVHFQDISGAHSTIPFGAVTCTYPLPLGSAHRVRAIIGGVGGAVALVVVLGLLFVGITFRRVRRKGTSGVRAPGGLAVGQGGIELPNYGSLPRSMA